MARRRRARASQALLLRSAKSLDLMIRELQRQLEETQAVLRPEARKNGRGARTRKRKKRSSG